MIFIRRTLVLCMFALAFSCAADDQENRGDKQRNLAANQGDGEESSEIKKTIATCSESGRCFDEDRTSESLFKTQREADVDRVVAAVAKRTPLNELELSTLRDSLLSGELPDLKILDTIAGLPKDKAATGGLGGGPGQGLLGGGLGAIASLLQGVLSASPVGGLLSGAAGKPADDDVDSDEDNEPESDADDSAANDDDETVDDDAVKQFDPMSVINEMLALFEGNNGLVALCEQLKQILPKFAQARAEAVKAGATGSSQLAALKAVLGNSKTSPANQEAEEEAAAD